MTTTPQGEIRPTLPPQAERNQAALTIGTAAVGLLEDVILGRTEATLHTLQIIATGLRSAGDLVQLPGIDHSTESTDKEVQP